MTCCELLFSYENEQRSRPITYAATELLSRVGIPFSICTYGELSDQNPRVLVTYGRTLPSSSLASSVPHIHIMESPFWGDTYGTKAAMPSGPVEKYEGIPVLCWGQPGKIADAEERSVKMRAWLPCDLIASTFLMLSRYEEVVLPERDQHDRFPARASIAFREGFLNRPVVDEYADLLWRTVLRTVGLIKRIRPWGEHDYAFCLTHDIDRIRLFSKIWHVASASLGAFRRKPLGVVRVARDFFRVAAGYGRNPYDTFADLLSLERIFGIRATYFFLSGGETRFDGRYALTDVRDTLHLLKENGHEIGLHGSYNSYVNTALLSSERASLEAVIGARVRSLRQHYLRFRVPDTWRAAMRSGLEVDSTLAFAQHEGFRAGTAYPFRPYDIEANQALEIWEVPLAVMDATLFGYRKMKSDHALKCIMRILDIVQTTGGVFVLLWHNSTLYEPLYPGAADLLYRVLQRVMADGALMETVSEVADSWARYRKGLECAF